MTMLERFESKYEPIPESGCWIWTACQHELGYGYFHTSKEYSTRKMDYAHRVSWYLYKGEKPPDNLLVCHKCDVPQCVNPAHLFLGTIGDNMRDMVSKQRWSRGKIKLSEKDVVEIMKLRKSGIPVLTIAKQFGISKSHCSRVSRGFHSNQSKLRINYGTI